jgi:hypothetical protein
MITPRITIKLEGNPHLEKQTRFALASALTKVGKEAQTAVQKSLRGTFQIRNNWLEQSNALGIRIKPAKKDDLTITIGTAAEFLEKFMKGTAGSVVIHSPLHGRFLAVPTTNVRRTKRQIIQAVQRPAALRGKRDFVLPMRKGGGFVLFQSVGRRATRTASLNEALSKYGKRRGNRQIVALYILKPTVKIREVDVLQGPVHDTFAKRFGIVFEDQLIKAFKTAR